MNPDAKCKGEAKLNDGRLFQCRRTTGHSGNCVFIVDGTEQELPQPGVQAPEGAAGASAESFAMGVGQQVMSALSLPMFQPLIEILRGFWTERQKQNEAEALDRRAQRRLLRRATELLVRLEELSFTGRVGPARETPNLPSGPVGVRLTIPRARRRRKR